MKKMQRRLYIYKDEVIGVAKGFEKSFIVAKEGRYGAPNRIKHRALPVCVTAYEAQIYLDAWAKSKGLPMAPEHDLPPEIFRWKEEER
jgi:hypothetical protein